MAVKTAKIKGNKLKSSQRVILDLTLVSFGEVGMSLVSCTVDLTYVRVPSGVGEAADGKIHSVETATYAASDVADETIVVDGVGQRLTLNIENIRGGGGQRRVSLFCPFWIVNTTEHSLRYKQDKAKTFVCGTVHGVGKDGSRPVDGSNRNYTAFT